MQCPACETKQQYSFDLNDANIEHGDVSHEYGITDHGDGTIGCILPRTQAEVRARLLTGREEKLLSNTKNTEGLISRQLRSIVVSVNGDSSPRAINYLIENMPSSDSRHLRLVIRQATIPDTLTRIIIPMMMTLILEMILETEEGNQRRQQKIEIAQKIDILVGS